MQNLNCYYTKSFKKHVPRRAIYTTKFTNSGMLPLKMEKGDIPVSPLRKKDMCLLRRESARR